MSVARSCVVLPALLVTACARATEPCACEDGHGVTLCDGGECTTCQCMPLAPATEDPAPRVTRFVDADAVDGDGSEASPWAGLDWDTLNADVAKGDVLVVFDAGDTWRDRVDIGRTDQGPYRIVLDGHDRRRTCDGWVDADGARATVPGITTGFEEVVRSRVTIRGFDVTGSRDKGIYWWAGDDVVIEDNLVHANRGTPAVMLDYTNRTGHRSTSFAVRNNHIWDQVGECIYIGGAEGEDMDAHEVVVIESNLVHDCTHAFSTHRDGINIKDRIGDVTVAGNVIFATHWGIEIASPGIVRGNLVFGTSSNGIHVTDEWGLGLSGLLLEDNVVIDAGDAGIYMNAENNAWSDVTIARFTVIGAGEAAIEAGGEREISGEIDDVVLANSAIGLDAWSPMELDLGECTVHGNGMAGDRDFADLAQDCVNDDPMFGDLTAPAGPDGRFFTDDDPWISASGGARI